MREHRLIFVRCDVLLEGDPQYQPAIAVKHNGEVTLVLNRNGEDVRHAVLAMDEYPQKGCAVFIEMMLPRLIAISTFGEGGSLYRVGQAPRILERPNFVTEISKDAADPKWYCVYINHQLWRRVNEAFVEHVEYEIVQTEYTPANPDPFEDLPF